MLEEEKGRWGDVFWQCCCSVKLPLLSAVEILLLCVCLSGSMSSCYCSGQKSAQTPIVLHTDLQLQAVLPNISALCHVCKIQCHLSAVIRCRHGICYLRCLFVLWKLQQHGILQTSHNLFHLIWALSAIVAKKLAWALPQSGCTSVSSPSINPNRLLTVKEDMPQSGSK